MDRSTAIKVFDACKIAGDALYNIPLDRSQTITDAEYEEVVKGVEQCMAYIADFLIIPAAREFPDLNPYR